MYTYYNIYEILKMHNKWFAATLFNMLKKNNFVFAQLREIIILIITHEKSIGSNFFYNSCDDIGAE